MFSKFVAVAFGRMGRVLTAWVTPLTAVVLSALTFAAPAASAPSRPPNILFIWTDEQNYGMLSCEGNAYITTPHLDRLARSGAVFSESFCTYPSCSPSRATVITGAYAFNHRLVDNIHPESGMEGVKPSDGYRITEQYLHDLGYATAHRGKWHAGAKRDWGACFTDDPGFSEIYSPLWNKTYKQEILAKFPSNEGLRDGSVGYAKGKTDLPTRLTPSWQAAFAKERLPDWAIVGELLVAPQQTMEFSIVDEAIRFISDHKDKPWMATVSLSPPHDPWSVPEPYFSKIAKPLMAQMRIEGSGRREDQQSSLSWRVGRAVGDRGIQEYLAVYHAQVVMMDDFIGRLLDTLDQLQLTNDTLVIFTSDHGDMQGLHHNVGKINHNLYNRLFHTPCIIAYPAKIKGGQTITRPVMHTDFMPTLLDYAGVASPKGVDGRSLRPLLEGASVDWRDYHFLEKFMNVTRNPDHSIKNTRDFYYAVGVEDGRYKYIYSRFNNKAMNDKYSGPRFIDLRNDPLEEKNLFEDVQNRELVKNYHAKLRAILTEHHFQFLAEYLDDPWAVR